MKSSISGFAIVLLGLCQCASASIQLSPIPDRVESTIGDWFIPKDGPDGNVTNSQDSDALWAVGLDPFLTLLAKDGDGTMGSSSMEGLLGEFFDAEFTSDTASWWLDVDSLGSVFTVIKAGQWFSVWDDSMVISDADGFHDEGPFETPDGVSGISHVSVYVPEASSAILWLMLAMIGGVCSPRIARLRK